MASEITEADYRSQPFFILDDASYDRMMHKLQNGSLFEWSYLGVCPHKKKRHCDCVKFMNVLRDSKIIRIAGGAQKPVYRASEYFATLPDDDDKESEIHVHVDRLLYERAEGYASTLKEMAASMPLPMTVRLHFSTLDGTQSAKVSSMSEFEAVIDRIVSLG